MRINSIAFQLFFSLLLCLPGQAQIEAEKLQGLKYRCVGPARGGRVTTVTGIPGEDFSFLMGTTGGGVWKTEDAGTTWRNITDGYLPVGSVGAIAVAPTDSNIIYAGTGAADLRGNVSIGKGLYKSINGGDSWEYVGLQNVGQISRIVISPKNPRLIYVAALGNPFGPNPERGVYRSANGGEDWQKVLYVSDRTGAVDLVMDPDNTNVLYAGMWTAERKPWTLIDGSEEGGLWKTTDGGFNWSKIDNGLPQGIVGRIGIAISPVNTNRIWVIQEAKEEKKGGLYRSDDGGLSFRRINRSHKLRQRAWYYSRVVAHPKDENTVFVLNVGLHKSTDGGERFSKISTPHSDNHDLWINPRQPAIMVEGNDGGACVTLNGGQTWSSQNNQPTAEFYRLTVDNQFPYRLYGAQQDNTTISVPSKPIGQLDPRQDWYTVGGGESGHIAVDTQDPDIIYAGNYIGMITRMDRAAGLSNTIMAYPQMHDGVAPRAIRYRFQWNAPIRISPHNSDIVYHCSQYVHRTRDGGKTWEIISPDLTTNNDAYQDIPGGPVQHDHTGVELYTTIFAFEESPWKAGELWAGSDDGLLHLSIDDGKNWEDITPRRLPEGGTINDIELSPHSPGKAFIAVYRYRENDFRPYIFRTDDYGRRWKILTNGRNGIPADHFVRVVVEDPVREGLLFAGTEYGIYISFDDGKNWQKLQRNLPKTPITDMVVKGNDLVVATQGRSFWIMDDISPLREINKRVVKSEAYLFTPSKAIKTQIENLDKIGGPDKAPTGALIYFYLPEGEADEKIRLEILDLQGNIRRVFSNRPDKQGEENMSLTEGLNRLEWDLKYESPETQDGARFSLANTGGIKAAPGTHLVRLVKEELILTRKLELIKDPRWDITHEDLTARYQLAMQAKELLNSCHQAIGEIRMARQQLQLALMRIEKANQPSGFSNKAEQLIEQLTELEQALIQTRSESAQDPINYPPKLDDQIAYLYSIVNGMDGRPGPGAYERLEDLKLAFEPHQQQIRVLKQEVLNLNSIFTENGLKPIYFKEP